jgi:glutathione S-transferase
MPPITLYFLQTSRCIRTAWLLEELGLEYELKFADRTAASRAPDEFKKESGNPLGKFPTLRDGDLLIHESGAITE